MFIFTETVIWRCTVEKVTQWRQDVNRTYVRRSEHVLDLFWTSYVRSIYIMCLVGYKKFFENSTKFTGKHLTWNKNQKAPPVRSHMQTHSPGGLLWKGVLKSVTKFTRKRLRPGLLFASATLLKRDSGTGILQ